VATAAVPAPADETSAAVGRFIVGAAEPVLAEDGEGLFALRAGCYALEERDGFLILQAWDEKRTFARRVIGVESQSRGKMILHVERFGRHRGRVALVDAAAPSAARVHRRAARLQLRENLHRFLRRNYASLRVIELTSEAVLSASLSPNFPRAFLRSGTEGWAAIAAPDDPLVADEVLSFGLIWLDYLRRRERQCAVRGLILYLPVGQERTTCLRLRHLSPRAAEYSVWACAKDGPEFRLDPADWGNLDTKVEPCRGTAAPSRDVRGRAAPELRLEAQVRAGLRRLDPELLIEPVYTQVPAFAATSHGLMDLLAADVNGRLAVIELKASEDIHLPLQALDYWMRVGWHVERGDFSSAGYFPGLRLRNEPPRLLLVAPALMFHSTNETVLRYFSSEVPVERIGTGIEWQKGLEVFFRAHSPCR